MILEGKNDSGRRRSITVELEGKFLSMPRRIRVHWYLKRKNEMDMELILNNINYILIIFLSEDSVICSLSVVKPYLISIS